MTSKNSSLESSPFGILGPTNFHMLAEFWKVGLNPGPVSGSRFVAKTL